MKIHPGFVGIDVSKHTLDVFDGSLGRHQRIANAEPAIDQLVDRLKAGTSLVLYEATGSYDRVLAERLAAAGIPQARVNPARARDFARAAGYLAKTDAVDAGMLAAMAQTLPTAPHNPPEADRQRLGRLTGRRDQLVAMRQQERNRQSECDDPTTTALLADHLAWLDQAIRQLDQAIAKHVRDSHDLARLNQRLRSVPGVGPVTATVLLAHLPELGQRSTKSIAALAGLAPFNNDSGARRGQRTIRGGRKRVRDALYSAAFIAKRFCPRFAAIYQAMLDAGKPRKLALIAVARRLLVTLNAMLRDDQTYLA